jgi:hypothetical protein
VPLGHPGPSHRSDDQELTRRDRENFENSVNHLAFASGANPHASPALVAQKLLMVMFNTVASNRNGRRSCPGNPCLFALLICVAVRSNCAEADEFRAAARDEGPAQARPAAPANFSRESPRSLSSFDLARFPELYTKFTVAPNAMYSTTDFRPRGTSLSVSESAPHAAGVMPTLRDASIWDRMADFKTSRGIRLLTLWESSGSTLSLQTGHGGSPSLQWTSRTMGRGEGTRSLLDHFFSTTIDNMQAMPRNGRTSPPTRPAHLIDKVDDLALPRRD